MAEHISMLYSRLNILFLTFTIIFIENLIVKLILK